LKFRLASLPRYKTKGKIRITKQAILLNVRLRRMLYFKTGQLRFYSHLLMSLSAFRMAGFKCCSWVIICKKENSLSALIATRTRCNVAYNNPGNLSIACNTPVSRCLEMTAVFDKRRICTGLASIYCRSRIDLNFSKLGPNNCRGGHDAIMFPAILHALLHALSVFLHVWSFLQHYYVT